MGQDFELQRGEGNAHIANEEIERTDQGNQAQTERGYRDIVRSDLQDLGCEQGEDGQPDEQNADGTQNDRQPENPGATIKNLQFLQDQATPRLFSGAFQVLGQLTGTIDHPAVPVRHTQQQQSDAGYDNHWRDRRRQNADELSYRSCGQTTLLRGALR